MRIPTDLEVTADRSALGVLINLVQNAVNYTPEGGNVELEALSSDGNVRIEVRTMDLYSHQVPQTNFRTFLSCR